MNGTNQLLDKILSMGFRAADQNDPIYQEGLQVFVTPSSSRLGVPSENPEGLPDSSFDLQNLPVDPVQMVASFSEQNSPEQNLSRASTTDESE